ncbi:uncharacterized protein JCM15063_002955 [Sporobolomyces koalae]|uniref:uncharacterized protein n=1 Tax=Sporobolomyces koalae TaxID=500713 RepID=UPI003170D60A
MQGITTQLAINLGKWKEDDNADWVGETGSTVVGKVASAPSEDVSTAETQKLTPKRPRAKRAAPSESWDEDFLFQNDSTPCSTPDRRTSRPPSRVSRSGSPIATDRSMLSSSYRDLSRQFRSSFDQGISGSAFERPSNVRLHSMANPSLDSLVSSLDWSATSDSEPTLKLGDPRLSKHSNPQAPYPVAQSRLIGRTSTTLEQHALAGEAPSYPTRPTPRPLHTESASRVPSGASTHWSDVPSLTADSVNSLTSSTTGDELETETEGDLTEDERGRGILPRLPSFFGNKRRSRDISVAEASSSPELKNSTSKRWKLGRGIRSPSDSAEVKGNQSPTGMSGRRTGPRALETVGDFDGNSKVTDTLRRSRLPLPVRNGEIVVLGRRERTRNETIISRNLGGAPSLIPGSVDASHVKTGGATEAGLRIRSIDKRLDVSIGHSPKTHGKAPIIPMSLRSPESSAFSSDASQPNSPIESILGDRIGRWNTSQVSFASTVSALDTDYPRPVTADNADKGRETPQFSEMSKQSKPHRKLVKRQPESELLAQRSSSLPSDKPACRIPNSLTSEDPRRHARNHLRSPSLPSAQDSEVDQAERPPVARRRSSTSPQEGTSVEQGHVIELDSEWLSIVPFPPTIRSSFEARGPAAFSHHPHGPNSATGRTIPLTNTLSPVETKTKRNSSRIGQSISNILGRKPSESGKRASSPPLPSTSGRSNRSLLTRSKSMIGQTRGAKHETVKMQETASASILNARTTTSNPSPIATGSRPSRDRSFPSTRLNPLRAARSIAIERSNAGVGSPLSSATYAKALTSPRLPLLPPRPSISLERSNNPHSTKSSGPLNMSLKMPSATPVAVSLPSSRATTVLEGSLPRLRSAHSGHRPSLSLSSLMRSPLPFGNSDNPARIIPPPENQSPHGVPQTALERGQPSSIPGHQFAGDEENIALPRRNSLSDLRIPARITDAQKKIEEDLNRVKLFAQAVEDLKELRERYDRHLRETLSFESAQRIRVEHAFPWEQAKTLIDLGDGKVYHALRSSPSTVASRKNGSASMSAQTTSLRNRNPNASPSGSETEIEAAPSSLRSSMLQQQLAANSSLSTSRTRPGITRVPSVSSIETAASVGVRQQEMLRSVLQSGSKGASFPSRRRAPSPRPGIARLARAKTTDDGQSRFPSTSASSSQKRPALGLQRPLASYPDSAKIETSRRVSRNGATGIREFFLRLRHRATEELARPITPSDLISSPCPPSLASDPPQRTVSDPANHPSSPAHSQALLSPSLLAQPVPRARRTSRTSSTSSSEDWDAELAIPSARRPLHRGQTVSAGGPHSSATDPEDSSGMMILTTENMPRLLDKAKEVQRRCQDCLEILESL